METWINTNMLLQLGTEVDILQNFEIRGVYLAGKDELVLLIPTAKHNQHPFPYIKLGLNSSIS